MQASIYWKVHKHASELCRIILRLECFFVVFFSLTGILTDERNSGASTKKKQQVAAVDVRSVT